MPRKEVISILEDSPIYWEASPKERLQLIRDLEFFYPYLFGGEA